MFGDDGGEERFEELLRSIAREVGRSMERVQQDLDDLAGSIGVDPTRAKEWVDGAVGWLRDQVEGMGGDVSGWSTHATGAKPDAGAQDTAPDAGAQDTAPDTGAQDTGPDTGAQDTAPDTGAQDTAPDTGAQDTAPDTGAQDATPEAGAQREGPDGERSSRGGPHPLDLPTDDQGAALAALDSGRWTVEPGSHVLVAHDGGPAPDDAQGLVEELRARDWIAATGEVTMSGRHALRRWLDAAGPR
jgi:hypothetical protein